MACAAHEPISPVQRKEWIQGCIHLSGLVPKVNPTSSYFCTKPFHVKKKWQRNKQNKLEAKLLGPKQDFYLWMYREVRKALSLYMFYQMCVKKIRWR